MNKSIKKINLILVIITFTLLACSKEVVPEVPGSKNLIIMQGVDATSLDPAMHTDTPSSNIDYQIFDTLLRRDMDMNLQPNIIKEWEMLDDITWEFLIREDIRFHNGEALTAKDIKFSIERIIDPDNKSPRISHYDFINQIKILDDFLIQIKTKNPSPILLSRLATLEVVPMNYIKQVGTSEFSQKPIGSGPYKLVKWIKDEEIVLDSFEDYWKGEAAIKSVVFKPVPEASARVMALQAGEANLITNLPPHNINELSTDNTEVKDVASTRVIFLAFTTENHSVENVLVRQAIELAVDSESIVKNLFSNKATSSNQIISVFDLGYNEEIRARSKNQEQAKALLAQAGIEDLTISFKSPSGRYLLDKEVAQAVASQLEAIGIKVNLQFEDFNTYVSKVINGSMDADMWLIGWGNDTFDAGATLSQWLHSSNPTSYYKIDDETNKNVDELIERALITLNDEKREQLYGQIIKQSVKDIAFVNLYQQNDIYGISSDLNWQARGDELIDIYNANWK